MVEINRQTDESILSMLRSIEDGSFQAREDALDEFARSMMTENELVVMDKGDAMARELIETYGLEYSSDDVNMVYESVEQEVDGYIEASGKFFRIRLDLGRKLPPEGRKR